MAEDDFEDDDKAPKSGHGGARAGGGRKRGTVEIAPLEAKQELASLARQYAHLAIGRLAWLIDNAKSEAAMAVASKEMLDRGFGKAPQAVFVAGKIDDQTRMTYSEFMAMINFTSEEKQRSVYTESAKASGPNKSLHS